MGYMPPTTRGHDFGQVTSAMQKAIRRADGRLAGYWAVELYESGYALYVWKRLLTISAEDCWGILTKEIWALFESWRLVNEGRPAAEKPRGRIFVAKAILLLVECQKSRDADHLTNLVYDAKEPSDEELLKWLEDARQGDPKIPEYALDCHTMEGKRRGKTKKDFFREEFEALRPREPGLFDKLPEKK